MRSWECQAGPVLRWWVFLILPSVIIATNKHYVIDYGVRLGEASVEIDQDTHLATITPSRATGPTTLISFRKSLVVYVTSKECMVSTLNDRESDYTQSLVHSVNHTHGTTTLYAMGAISPNRVKKFLGDDLFAWCAGKPTLRLSKRKPKLPSNIFSLKDVATSEVAGQALRSLEESTHEIEHRRYKRKAKKGKKSRGRKEKKSAKGHRRKGKKSKNKKGKKPKTKSLRNRAQKLNIIAPRVSFPLSLIQHNLTADPAIEQAPNDHVVLQEKPYLSSSFIRSEDDGQRFRHYRDFNQEPSNDTRSQGATNRIISHDTREPIDGQSKISIPETIVKDGQIFYRYDAEESTPGAKGQSKRSHTRDEDFMDDGVNLEGRFEYYNDSGDSLDQHSFSTINQGFPLSHRTSSGSKDDGQGDAGQILNTDHGKSHVQTQAQMRDEIRGASAGALTGTGYGTEVQGNSDSTGYFIAQAHSRGRQGGGMNLAHVFGNKHGVLGSAMASGHGHQSHVQVDMGANPSSTAHVTSHGGSTSLSSSVHATQLGGRAGAHAYGNGASTSNAHMEFNPSHQYGTSSRLTGQGSASATVTNSGSALLTSLSGDVSGGSYLGTAQSSMRNNLGLSSHIENDTKSTHEDFGQSYGITQGFGQTNSKLGGLEETSQFHEDLAPRRQVFDQTHHGSEHFREIGSEVRQDGSSHPNNVVDPNPPGHSSEGQIIGNIMETVHQPDMQPEIIAYPFSDFSIIDNGGLTVGAGVPPRESEIEQIPISSSEDIQEGIGIIPGPSKTGIVGLATYSHGRLGAPPGPGELLNYPHQPDSSQYDYGYYDNRYNSEYYDERYDGLSSQDPNNLPFFDLGPEIVGFEPIESNFENFQPMQLGLPVQPVAEPSSEQTDHSISQLTNFHMYDLESQDITPDPPIIVHQVQASTLLPEETFSGVAHTSHSQSSNYSRPNITSSHEKPSDFHGHERVPQTHEEESDFYDHSPIFQGFEYEDEDTYDHTPIINVHENSSTFDDHKLTQEYDEVSNLYNRASISQSYDGESHIYDPSSIPQVHGEERSKFYDGTHSPQALTETPSILHMSTREPTVKVSQYQSLSDTHIPVSHMPASSDSRIAISPSNLHNETDLTDHRGVLTSQESLQLTTQPPVQSQSSVALNIQPQIGTGSMMMGIPLNPGNPGSVQNLPGNEGGPDLKIMSLSASEARGDRSLLHQRKGTSLQPGEKIPGAPGYSVPPGFRGHVILGHNLPVSTESRRVVQGFNTQVRLSPQNRSPSSPVYTSVSGPGASQQLISQDNPTSVHITLSRNNTHSPARASDGMGMASSQQDFTHSVMQSQPISSSTSRTFWNRQGNIQSRKSWDGRQHGMTTPQKSWGGNLQSRSHGMQRTDNDDACGYYSMNCEVVYGPHEQSNICQPILITIDCCC